MGYYMGTTMHTIRFRYSFTADHKKTTTDHTSIVKVIKRQQWIISFVEDHKITTVDQNLAVDHNTFENYTKLPLWIIRVLWKSTKLPQWIKDNHLTK